MCVCEREREREKGRKRGMSEKKTEREGGRMRERERGRSERKGERRNSFMPKKETQSRAQHLNEKGIPSPSSFARLRLISRENFDELQLENIPDTLFFCYG